MSGSIADHDDLVQALDAAFGLGRTCEAPLVLQQRLTEVARRCGWDGADDAMVWAARRVEVYHRTITGRPT